MQERLRTKIEPHDILICEDLLRDEEVTWYTWTWAVFSLHKCLSFNWLEIQTRTDYGKYYNVTRIMNHGSFVYLISEQFKY